MSASNTIEHIGTVKNITPSKVIVEVKNSSACSSCHAKGACGMSNTSSSLIEADKSGEEFSVGEQVNVLIEKIVGFKALFLGYVLPFLIFILTLLSSSIFIKSELLEGILALMVLIPYYFILFMLRSKIEKTFEFKVKKI